MPEFKPQRAGETSIDLPSDTDAGVFFIGRIHTPWAATADCPKNSRARTDVIATIDLDSRYSAGLKDLQLYSHAIVLYWLHQSRRDLIEQMPSHLSSPRGVFALRSPVRPNPIGLAVVEILTLEGNRLQVRNIDCIDGTPVIDIKPYFASLDAVPDARRP